MRERAGYAFQRLAFGLDAEEDSNYACTYHQSGPNQIAKEDFDWSLRLDQNTKQERGNGCCTRANRVEESNCRRFELYVE